MNHWTVITQVDPHTGEASRYEIVYADWISVGDSGTLSIGRNDDEGPLRVYAAGAWIRINCDDVALHEDPSK